MTPIQAWYEISISERLEQRRWLNQCRPPGRVWHWRDEVTHWSVKVVVRRGVFTSRCRHVCVHGTDDRRYSQSTSLSVRAAMWQRYGPARSQLGASNSPVRWYRPLLWDVMSPCILREYDVIARYSVRGTRTQLCQRETCYTLFFPYTHFWHDNIM